MWCIVVLGELGTVLLGITRHYYLVNPLRPIR